MNWNYSLWYKLDKGIYYDLLEKDNVIKLLDLQKQDVILDAGCGDGRFTFEAAKKVKKVYAMDNLKIAIKEINKKIKEKNISNIETFEVDLAKKFPPEFPYFDKIFSVQVLQHIKGHRQRVKALKNIYNSLKSEGKFVLLVCNGSRIINKLKVKKKKMILPSNITYYYYFKWFELKKILKKIGFKNIKILGSHNFPGRIYKFNFYKKLIKGDIFLTNIFVSKFFGIYLLVSAYK